MLAVCCRQAVMLTEVAEGDMRLSVLMHQSCMVNSLWCCVCLFENVQVTLQERKMTNGVYLKSQFFWNWLDREKMCFISQIYLVRHFSLKSSKT